MADTHDVCDYTHDENDDAIVTTFSSLLRGPFCVSFDIKIYTLLGYLNNLVSLLWYYLYS